jgi:ATP-dependent protease HslVU (ClpYQ) peptidase subunit
VGILGDRLGWEDIELTHRGVVGDATVVVGSKLLKMTAEGLRRLVVRKTQEKLVGANVVDDLLDMRRDVLEDVDELLGRLCVQLGKTSRTAVGVPEVLQQHLSYYNKEVETSKLAMIKEGMLNHVPSEVMAYFSEISQ